MTGGKNILVNWSGRVVLLSCLLLAACEFTQAQVRFYPSAPKSVALNQEFELVFVVENGEPDGFKPPSLNDFEVLGSSRSSNFGFDGSRMTKSVNYIYDLQPKREGTFRIGRAQVRVGGATMESSEVAITVTGISKQIQQAQQQAAQEAQQQQQMMQQMMQQMQQQMQQQFQPMQKPSKVDNANVEKAIKENVFLRFVTDKNSVYLGEHITATIKLYYLADWGNPQLVKAPTFDGFWSQEVQMPKEAKPYTETFNGKKYNVQDIQVYNLFPQRSGILKISPVEINMLVRLYMNRGMIQQAQDFNYKAVSNGIDFNVKEVPAAGKPANFSGAVGQFTYSAKISSQEGKTDNALTYTVKISGTGNLKTIEIPKPEIPDGFEVFDPKVKDDVTSTATGMSGSKQYDYLIIPRQPGEYKIPGSSFSYFDPVAGKYFTLSSPELPLKVTGQPSQNLNTGESAAASKEDVSALHSDIRFIKTKAVDLEKAGAPFFGSVGYIGLMTTPALLFIGLIFVRKKNEDLAADLVGAKRRRATKLAKKRLSEAEKHLSQNKKQAFYDEVSRALWGYLGDKLNIDLSQLSKDNVEEKLLARNVKPESVNKLKTLISTCEVALYAPSGAADEMKQNYNSAIALITDLEDEIK